MNTEISLTDMRPIFKILCVDGGGFRGLSAASTLNIIEQHNGSLLDHFDLLCGTSTGGLIALALAAGKRAEEIVEFYCKRGPEIFPPLNRLAKWGHVFRIAFSKNKHKFGDQVLRAAVENILEDKKMCNSEAFLCIPSLNITTFQPRVFKTDHDEILNYDGQRKMSEVALATSAAPTLFPIASSKAPDGYYVDGGLWANDPTMVGLIEALRFFAGEGKPYGSVELLSIGCSSGISGRPPSPTYLKRGDKFVTELVEAVGNAQQESTQRNVAFLQNAFSIPVRVTRITPSGLSTTQAKSVSLDTATQQAIETLIQLGVDTGHAWKSRPEICAFFNEPAQKIGLRPNVN